MKILSAAFLISFVPALVNSILFSAWKFDAIPDKGLDNIAFKYNLVNAPRVYGYLFAHQLNFFSTPQGAYIGIMPRDDIRGQIVVRVVYSTFQEGTTTESPHCHEWMDGSPGINCEVNVLVNYRRSYLLEVENMGNTTWRAKIVDAVTGARAIVGEWTLPEGSGLITNGEQGFVEYLPWHDGEDHDCWTLPWTEFTVSHPTSTTPGASGGRIPWIYEDEECVDQQGAIIRPLDDGYNVQLGFK